MKISELKAYIFAPSRTIMEVFQLKRFFRDSQGAFPRNKRKLNQALAKTARIEKYASQRWGDNWEDKWND
jgi:hypothetical protein